jgi:hypothetical protein
MKNNKNMNVGNKNAIEDPSTLPVSPHKIIPV